MENKDDRQADLEIIRRSWNKLEKDLAKAGLREGITEGKDSNFQQGFDLGFEEGFRNASKLGFCKGALRANSELRDIKLDANPLLEHTKRGNCQICSDQELLKQPTGVVISKQHESTARIVRQLQSKHPNDIPLERIYY